MWLKRWLGGGLAGGLGGPGEKFVAKVFKLQFLHHFSFNLFETSMQSTYKYDLDFLRISEKTEQI